MREGSLYVESDISTRANDGSETNGQLVLASLAIDGLANIPSSLFASSTIDRLNPVTK